MRFLRAAFKINNGDAEQSSVLSLMESAETSSSRPVSVKKNHLKQASAIKKKHSD